MPSPEQQIIIRRPWGYSTKELHSVAVWGADSNRGKPFKLQKNWRGTTWNNGPREADLDYPHPFIEGDKIQHANLTIRRIGVQHQAPTSPTSKGRQRNQTPRVLHEGVQFDHIAIEKNSFWDKFGEAWRSRTKDSKGHWGLTLYSSKCKNITI